jgi:hypothetical protein
MVRPEIDPAGDRGRKGARWLKASGRLGLLRLSSSRLGWSARANPRRPPDMRPAMSSFGSGRAAG